MLDQITPLVLTRDEEDNIGRTLGQLAWAREVVVLDSFSTDRTIEIARRFPNVRILERAFDDHASQWRAGAEAVGTPWVLTLDADYFVPDSLVRELAALTVSDDVTGYEASFLYAINGRTMRASLYPPRIVLLRRGSFEFTRDGHTQRVVVKGRIVALREKIVHDDRKPFSRFIARQRRYMKQEAEKLRSSDMRSLPLSGRVRKLVVVAPLAVLIHSLFVKGLILEGLPGWRYAAERFIAELILSRELLRSRRQHE